MILQLLASKAGQLSTKRWQWFIGEYEAAFGHKPKIRFEELGEGKATLAEVEELYLQRTPGTFAQFQARFNLLIALFPLGEWQKDILRLCMADQVSRGLNHREYRIFLDYRISGWEKVFAVAAELNAMYASQSSCSLVVSMPHNHENYLKAYRSLDSFFAQQEAALDVFAGFDFCMFEEKYRPEDKKDMLAQTRTFGSHSKEIPLLIHVGETLETISLLESLQRIETTIELGATRLGHACSLARKAQTREEKNLQEKIDAELINKHTLIETCPTSNTRIANVKQACASEFTRRKLPFLVCSDDPGMLDTSLEKEIALVEQDAQVVGVAAEYPERFPFRG